MVSHAKRRLFLACPCKKQKLPPKELIKVVRDDHSLAKMFIIRPFNRNLILNELDTSLGWRSTNLHQVFELEPTSLIKLRTGVAPHSFTITSCSGISSDDISQIIVFNDIGLDSNFMNKYKPTVIISQLQTNYREFNG
uniref:F-box domain-containing protein n=1 Tax=Rhabditophanes sp. KR3021 TaxID=114890 RepID=A0AC35TX35_9BILA